MWWVEGLVHGLSWFIALGNLATGMVGLSYYHNLDAPSTTDRRVAEDATMRVMLGAGMMILAIIYSYRSFTTSLRTQLEPHFA